MSASNWVMTVPVISTVPALMLVSQCLVGGALCDG